MPDDHRRRVDWGTYAEARADVDRIVEGLENRFKARLDELQRTIERGFDHQRQERSEFEARIRALEQELATIRSQDLARTVDALKGEVTVLRTTNRLLAATGGALLGLMGLAIAALAAWRSP